MNIRPRTALLAAAAVALAAGALAAPVLAHGWFGGRGGGPGMTLLDTFDTNKDGRITQEEIDAARQQQLARYDRNGDGQLSLEEYQALWLDAMRERMVRQFQANDRDGNGEITVVEFQERFADVVRDRDRNGDGALTADELRPRRGWHGGRDRGPGPGDDGPGRGPDEPQ
jgi:hypothetical protein